VLLAGIGIALTILLIIAAWLLWGTLFSAGSLIFPMVMGVLTSALIFFCFLPLVEVLRANQLRKAWRRRLEEREGLAQPPGWRYALDPVIQSLNAGLNQVFQRGLAQTILGWWQDSGWGKGPLSFIVALLGTILAGALLGHYAVETLLIKTFIIFLLLTGFFTLLYFRARLQRQMFQDQFPAVLDRLADSLQAGFSLPQAIAFVVPNLSQPSSGEMSRIAGQIQLGYTVEEALQELYARRPSEDVRVLVEGLTLQRQVGGNMAAMMREMADLVRSRVELENEVRTMTAQGRLSAVVIALLVPVSLILLSLFPGYTDVLFKTTIGNLVLVAAGMLELLGAVIVARLVRIEV
jgi:tight adherence protein B